MPQFQNLPMSQFQILNLPSGCMIVKNLGNLFHSADITKLKVRWPANKE